MTAATTFRTDVQGLRAVAVLLVVGFHAGVPLITGGFIGVDIFFVISGFLITGQILDGVSSGPFAFGSFYAKRARRILPASFVVVILTVIAALIWLPPLQLSQVFGAAAATVLYVPNVFFAVRGTDYFSDASTSVFQQYWSLGVEEQFYLVWPALIVGAFVIFGRSEKRILWLLLSVVTVSLAAGIVLTFTSQTWAFFSLPTRAWELAAGGLVQFALRRGVRLPATLRGPTSWAGFAGLVAASFLIDKSMPFPGVVAILPVAATALIIFAGTDAREGALSRMLSIRPFVFIGTISYSMYLVHWPLLVIPHQAAAVGPPLPWWIDLLLGAASVPLAWILYRTVENPLRHWGPLARRKPRVTLLWSGTVSVAVAGAVVAGVSLIQMATFSSSRAAEAMSIDHPVDSTDFVPVNLTPSLERAEADRADIYKGSCDAGAAEVYSCERGAADGERTVALFGDSHAAQWAPAFEEVASEAGARLLIRVRNACPSVDVSIVREGVLDVACNDWRRATLSALLADPPDVVVLSNLGGGRLNEPRVSADEWEAGLARTVGALSAVSDVVILGDTPKLDEYPPYCLSAHLENADACGLPRNRAENTELLRLEQQFAAAEGLEFVDLNDHLCTSDFCPAIVGDTLVYRDSHHITATMARALAPALGESRFWSPLTG